jgi:hypothetical protein
MPRTKIWHWKRMLLQRPMASWPKQVLSHLSLTLHDNVACYSFDLVAIKQRYATYVGNRSPGRDDR